MHFIYISSLNPHNGPMRSHFHFRDEETEARKCSGICLRQGFLTSWLLSFGLILLRCGNCPVLRRMFSSILGLYLLDANSILPPLLCQSLPRGKSTPSREPLASGHPVGSSQAKVRARQAPCGLPTTSRSPVPVLSFNLCWS